MQARRVGDLELLQIEMDLLWPSGGPELVVGCARDGVYGRLSGSVPDGLARELVAQVQATDPRTGLGTPPPLLEHWRAALERALGASIALAPGSGPSYLIQDDVVFPGTAPLLCSDGGAVHELRDANPGNWGADEWLDLLSGRSGPWAMATQRRQPPRGLP